MTRGAGQARPGRSAVEREFRLRPASRAGRVGISRRRCAAHGVAGAAFQTSRARRPICASPSGRKTTTRRLIAAAGGYPGRMNSGCAQLDGDGPAAKSCRPRSSDKGGAGAAARSLVRLPRVRTARSVARAASTRRSRDRAPRIQRIDGADQIVVEADQILSGIGLISNAGRALRGARDHLRPGAPRGTCSAAGTTPSSISRTWALDGGGPAEVLYPSQGLFYFRVADTGLMSAIFRALQTTGSPSFCRTDANRLKGIAMINLDGRPGRDPGAGARRAPWASAAP